MVSCCRGARATTGQERPSGSATSRPFVRLIHPYQWTLKNHSPGLKHSVDANFFWFAMQGLHPRTTSFSGNLRAY